ncbi:MAG TPA: hypothetical protein VLA19_22815 [Herpetosiphonaceae bacterium]|nr:hypothetical protein [Herpetosiphonaceae bacterium]
MARTTHHERRPRPSTEPVAVDPAECGGPMEREEPGYRLYVGIDIAADTFTAAWLAGGGTPSTPFSAEQTPSGFAALQRRLRGVADPEGILVVLEATAN